MYVVCIETCSEEGDLSEEFQLIVFLYLLQGLQKRHLYYIGNRCISLHEYSRQTHDAMELQLTLLIHWTLGMEIRFENQLSK